MPVLSGLIVVLLYTGFIFGIFFIAAGSWDFPFVWMSYAVYLLIAVINVFLVEPGLISERLKMGGEGVIQRDRILASVSFLFYLPITILIAGLDRGRFGWSGQPHFSLQVVGFILFCCGNLFARWAVASNRFFSTFVRIQYDRGHQVESGGPYKYIRHPGYAGAILAALALPAAISSFPAFIPAVIGSAGFILRTALEDQELIRNLEGYRDYSKLVRFRLFPGVW